MHIVLQQWFPYCGTRDSFRWNASFFSLLKNLRRLINMRRPFFLVSAIIKSTVKCLIFRRRSFFWSAGMVVARWNLAGSGCGLRNEKVADPCTKAQNGTCVKKKIGNHCSTIYTDIFWCAVQTNLVHLMCNAKTQLSSMRDGKYNHMYLFNKETES